MITSRHRLPALDGVHALPLDVMPSDQAARLLLRVAARDALATDADPTTATQAGAEFGAVARVVRLCGYLPLAIALAAGRLCSHPTWSITYLADLLDQAPDRLEDLTGFGYVHQMRGQYEQAVSYFGRALENSQDVGSRHGELTALNGLAEVHWMWGRDDEGVDCLKRALVIARKIGDRHGEVDAVTGFGYGHYMRGRYEQAVGYLERALEIAQDTGDMHGERTALIGLGFSLIHLMPDRYEQASGYLQRALEIAQDTGNLRKEGIALTGVGYVYLMRDRHEQVVDCLERALEIAQETACRDGQFEAHHGLGRVYCATGDHDRALVHHRIALDLATELGQPADQARAHDGLTHAHHAIGQLESAHHHWQTALNILTARGWERTEDPQITVAALRAHLAGSPYRSYLNPITQGDRSNELATVVPRPRSGQLGTGLGQRGSVERRSAYGPVAGHDPGGSRCQPSHPDADALNVVERLATAG